MQKKAGSAEDILNNPHAEGVEHADPEPENEADSETDGGEQAEETEVVDGGEDQENGSGAGEGEGAEGGEGEGEGEGETVKDGEGDPEPEQTEEERIAELVEKKLAEREAAAKKPEPEAEEPIPERPEEEVMQLAEKRGWTPEAVKDFDATIVHVLNSVKKYVESQFQSRFADQDFAGVIDQYSKDKAFPNIKAFQKPIMDFLKEKKIDPRNWKDRDVIDIAYHYVKAKGVDVKVKKIISAKERNLKISKPPASKGGASKGAGAGKKYPPLSPEEDRIRRKEGMSIEEWNNMGSKSVSELTA